MKDEPGGGARSRAVPPPAAALPQVAALPSGAALRRLLLRRAAAGSGLLAGGLAAGGSFAAGRAREGTSRTAVEDSPFSFGLIGDTPYSPREADALRRILAAMATEPLEFVLHVGDIKSSVERCTDELLSSRLALLDESPHPLILTPGDNEWTDCGRSLRPWDTGGRLERLEWLRARVYRRAESLGRRRMAVRQQAAYRSPAGAAAPDGPGGIGAAGGAVPKLPENLRWRLGSLQFCTLHVVGSNNAPRQAPELAQAWLLRQEANGDWLNETVQMARRDQAKGLVIAMHADMRFELDRMDGWERMRRLVVAAAAAFDGPVLLLHGDTHIFRSDRVLRRSHGLANFQRVESFGSPFSSSWVQIRWDPALARAGAGEESDAFQVSIRALP